MAPSVKLPTRALGKNGPQVVRQGLGLMSASGIYGIPKPDAERLAFLDKAYEMGQTFWDTADMYGDSEDLLGKWFAANPEKRASIFLATKFGHTHSAAAGHGVDSTPEYCRAAIDRSLARLGLPYVDLFYIHRLDRATPVEHTMQAMAELKRAGKIRHVGLSECSAASLRRAHAVHPVACVQMEYSAFSLDIESPGRDLLAAARDLGVAVVAYSPLGKGMLTGAIRSNADASGPGDGRGGFMPRFSEENIATNVALVDRLAAIAELKGVTTAQLALAWILAQGDDMFPIPGTSSVARLTENLGALDVELTEEEERTIRGLADDVAGSHMPTIMREYFFADTPPLES